MFKVILRTNDPTLLPCDPDNYRGKGEKANHWRYGGKRTQRERKLGIWRLSLTWFASTREEAEGIRKRLEAAGYNEVEIGVPHVCRLHEEDPPSYRLVPKATGNVWVELQ